MSSPIDQGEGNPGKCSQHCQGKLEVVEEDRRPSDRVRNNGEGKQTQGQPDRQAEQTERRQNGASQAQRIKDIVVVRPVRTDQKTGGGPVKPTATGNPDGEGVRRPHSRKIKPTLEAATGAGGNEPEARRKQAGHQQDAELSQRTGVRDIV